MNSHPRARVPGRLLLACAFAAPLCLNSVYAQTADSASTPPSSKASADDATTVALPPVVVTARRIKEDPVDVPAYTQVITRADIENSGATNLIELLKTQANLDFISLSSSPANTKVSLRGTGIDGNGRTLILVDGIRTNRPDMGDYNWLQFPLQDIESIE
ncbi:MAG TPA: TonB-dependent receptor plug domain-containing protein, partial [Rariglobus sp.]